MSKIVYLLGAGASYGKRNEGEPKNSPKRIVEGLPVVNEIDNEFSIVVDWVKNCDIAGLNTPYSFCDKELDAASMKSMFIDDLIWLQDKAAQHATIDTFAKKLYLCNQACDFGKLKLLLSSFFLIEQVIHPFDKRYDTFFANILNRNAMIPDNVYIMSHRACHSVMNRSFYLHKYQLFTFNKRCFYYGFVAILPKIRCKYTN